MKIEETDLPAILKIRILSHDRQNGVNFCWKVSQQSRLAGLYIWKETKAMTRSSTSRMNLTPLDMKMDQALIDKSIQVMFSRPTHGGIPVGNRPANTTDCKSCASDMLRENEITIRGGNFLSGPCLQKKEDQAGIWLVLLRLFRLCVVACNLRSLEDSTPPSLFIFHTGSYLDCSLKPIWTQCLPCWGLRRCCQFDRLRPCWWRAAVGCWALHFLTQ